MTLRRPIQGLAALVVIYAVYGAIMIYLHPRFLYPFSQEVLEMSGFERHEIAVPGHDPLGVWRHPAPTPDAPVILYFMGNVGTLDIHMAPLKLHADAGRTVIAMEYRGGGGMAGTASEDRLKADGLAVFDALPGFAGAGPVFVHGYSLGTGIALHVASQRQVVGVILDAPYARICDLMRRASLLPACWMPLVQKWDSLAYAGSLSAPVLLQHGDGDTKIPPAEGEKIAQSLRRGGAEVIFNDLKGGTHGKMIEVPGYIESLEAFLLANLPGL